MDKEPDYRNAKCTCTPDVNNMVDCEGTEDKKNSAYY